MRDDFDVVLTGIQKQALRDVAEFICMAAVLLVHEYSGEFVRTDGPQAAKGWFGKGQRHQRLMHYCLLAGLNIDFCDEFLIARIDQPDFVLAGREGLGSGRAEVCRRTQIFAIHKNARAPRLDFRDQ